MKRAFCWRGRASALHRLLLERQVQVTQILAGLNQDQRTLVDHHRRRTLARHMHRLRFCSDGGLHGCHLVRIGVDPLQAGGIGDLVQLGQRQGIALDTRQATGGGCCSRCWGAGFSHGCGNRCAVECCWRRFHRGSFLRGTFLTLAAFPALATLAVAAITVARAALALAVAAFAFSRCCSLGGGLLCHVKHDLIFRRGDCWRASHAFAVQADFFSRLLTGVVLTRRAFTTASAAALAPLAAAFTTVFTAFGAFGAFTPGGALFRALTAFTLLGAFATFSTVTATTLLAVARRAFLTLFGFGSFVALGC